MDGNLIDSFYPWWNGPDSKTTHKDQEDSLGKGEVVKKGGQRTPVVLSITGQAKTEQPEMSVGGSRERRGLRRKNGVGTRPGGRDGSANPCANHGGTPGRGRKGGGPKKS